MLKNKQIMLKHKLSTNGSFIIGLISSIITAGMGYLVRHILLKYLDYDVFTNLDDWTLSLSYFCSLGGIRFVINEWIKENAFRMYFCGGTDSSICNKQVGYISTMQSPNNPGIGNSRPAGSSGALITDVRSILQQKLSKVEAKIDYFTEQVNAAKYDLDHVLFKKPFYIERGEENKWHIEYQETVSVMNDCKTNLSSELRMHKILKTKLENEDYSISDASATTKRSFTASSMSNDDSSTRTNKRTSDNQ